MYIIRSWSPFFKLKTHKYSYICVNETWTTSQPSTEADEGKPRGLRMNAAAPPPLSRTAATAHRASGGSAGLASKGCAPAGRASASRSSATAVQGRCRRSRRRGRFPVETSCSRNTWGYDPSVANATAPLKGAPRLPRLGKKVDQQRGSNHFRLIAQTDICKANLNL